MSRNACENRRNGNDFHSGHRKQNSDFSVSKIIICTYLFTQYNTYTYLYAHQQFNHPYLPVDPNAPVPRSSHDSKIKSGIRTGMITSCPTLSPILISYSLFPTLEMIA